MKEITQEKAEKLLIIYQNDKCGGKLSDNSI